MEHAQHDLRRARQVDGDALLRERRVPEAVHVDRVSARRKLREIEHTARVGARCPLALQRRPGDDQHRSQDDMQADKIGQQPIVGEQIAQDPVQIHRALPGVSRRPSQARSLAGGEVSLQSGSRNCPRCPAPERLRPVAVL